MGKVAVIVLKTVAAAGLLTMAVCAPNALQALGFLDRKYRRPEYVNRVAERLCRQGYLRRVVRGTRTYYAVTAKAQHFLNKVEIGKYKMVIPKQWDGQFRMIIFDIPEKVRAKRDEIRRWLQHLNFVRLQDSVWVYPYPCRQIVALLKTKYGVENEVLYVTVASIEHDAWLRRLFGLL